ncbi:hypothetical protein V6N13_080631 [Hibiscus sabdariffa]|uniref:Uncharacterized protein n=1 Tax=Hibiscus sabdariffa TaxID=183260 RepID=A0ABR2BG23_9ROSI
MGVRKPENKRGSHGLDSGFRNIKDCPLSEEDCRVIIVDDKSDGLHGKRKVSQNQIFLPKVSWQYCCLVGRIKNIYNLELVEEAMRADGYEIQLCPWQKTNHNLELAHVLGSPISHIEVESLSEAETTLDKCKELRVEFVAPKEQVLKRLQELEEADGA